MKVFTPGALARATDSKYLGVLVAAKYARSLNELRRGLLQEEEPVAGAEPYEKLTTTALESVTRGAVEYRLTERRRPEL